MNIVNSHFEIKFCFLLVTIFLAFNFGCKNVETKADTFSTPVISPTVLPTPKLTTSNDTEIKWIPGSFSGIEIGKSNRDDVVEKFGKPIWEGDEELEGEESDIRNEIEKHGGKRTLMEYKDVGDLDGQISVYFRKQDQIVQEIVYYPKKPFPKEWIEKKYGKAYIELFGTETICSALESYQKVDKSEEKKIPELLVFPKVGMYASPNKQWNIDKIGFSLTCD